MGKKAISEDTRWQIIGMSKLNVSNVFIGKQLGVSEKCVRTTLRNFKLNNTVQDSPRCGRPTELTPKDKSKIFRMQRKNPTLSFRKIAKEFNSSGLNVRVSHETVRKVLRNKGLLSYVAIRKPLLTLRDRLKRKKWCKDRLLWTVEDWSRVIFSDESNFEVMNRKGRVIVKRFKSEKYHSRYVTPRLQGGGGSVGIWGCISHKGRGLCNIYTGRINQYSYLEILKNSLLPSVRLFYNQSKRWIFQQDGASAHTANSVKAWMEKKKFNVLPWCPRSPDLNPIEHVWAIIDRQMMNIKVTSVEHLKEVLKQHWDDFPKEVVMQLIESMPRRVRACYKAKGGHFKY